MIILTVSMIQRLGVGQLSGSDMRWSSRCQPGLQHMRACWRLEHYFPDGSLMQLKVGASPRRVTSVSSPVWPHHTVLEYHNMAVEFSRRSYPRGRGRDTHTHTHAEGEVGWEQQQRLSKLCKSHIITSALLYSLETHHGLQPTLKGWRIRLHLLKEQVSKKL